MTVARMIEVELDREPRPGDVFVVAADGTFKHQGVDITLTPPCGTWSPMELSHLTTAFPDGEEAKHGS